MGEPSSMVCSKHSQKSSSSNGGNNSTGGICAFCLQEKLGNLVSSSYPNAIFPSSTASSPSSPSFRSDSAANAAPFAASSTSHGVRRDVLSQEQVQVHHPRRARIIPFLSTYKKKSRRDLVKSSTSLHHGGGGNVILKRSMSTMAPRCGGLSFPAMEEENYISQRKRFWSFLYHHSKTGSSATKPNSITVTSTPSATSLSRRTMKGKDFVDEGEDESPEAASSASTTSFERKVSRSRSVGCGSRRFSGDFFERISTGFGDCTLRQVESQREGKPKVGSSIKERARCGGIFGGFIMTPSSSSSSSSSYWTAAESKTPGRMSGGPESQGRNKSWIWAFASPLRAFSKPNNNKSNKNATPNLAAMPSLLVV